MKGNDSDRLSRRDFVKAGTIAGIGAAITGSMMSGCSKSQQPAPYFFTAEKCDPVRIGFVGVGLQGSSHVRNFLRIPGVKVKAVCDVVEEKVKRIQDWTVEAGQPKPTGYFKGETDFLRMCDNEELDLVFNSTPWKWHVPVCVASMETGKHTAVEVPAAMTIDDCWKLVETSEKTRRYCSMMENCNYGRRELMFLNMVRQGVFGELMHSEVGYLHDLRAIKFENKDEGLWRREHAKHRNGNLYPTHGLGPAALWMDINRGDAFEYLVSLSSNSRGLQEYAEAHFTEDDPRRHEKYVLGDVNISLIKTVKGKTITVYHDCNLPRPYSRGNVLQGTKAIAEGYPDRIHIEGTSPGHQWEELMAYREKYDHPLWKALESEAIGAGHGGMDFLEDYRLIEALRTGTPPDMDVYEAAAVSVVCELSEISVANKSKPVDFPDFTRGTWRTRKPVEIPV